MFSLKSQRLFSFRVHINALGLISRNFSTSFINKHIIESWGETHDMENFMKGHFRVANKISISCFDISQIEIHLTSNRSIRIRINKARSGPSNISLIRFIFSGSKENNISFNTLSINIIRNLDFSTSGSSELV